MEGLTFCFTPHPPTPCTLTCTHTCTRTHAHAHAHAHMHTHLHTHMHAHLHTCTHTHAHVHAHAHAHTHICTHTHLHAHATIMTGVGFFLVHIDKEEIKLHTLSEFSNMWRPGDRVSSPPHTSSYLHTHTHTHTHSPSLPPQLTVGFCDPSTLDLHPGWPLRNFLALVGWQWYVPLWVCDAS